MNDSSRMLGAGKMLHHLDRLAGWQAGGMPAPVTVELNVTNACNHACPGCTFSYLVNVSKDSLPSGLAKEIIRQLAEFGVKAVTFSGGGEPLVYGEARVLELATLARSHGLDVALITNGSLLRSSAWHALCKWVRVSLDAYDESTFERFHGRSAGEFAKVVANLREWCAMPRGMATRGVGFLTDSGSLDRDDFARMARFCAGINGLDYVQFRPLVTNMIADPTLKGGEHLDAEQVAKAHQEAKELYERPDFKVLSSEGKYVALNQANHGREYNRCLAHFLEAAIAADGKVYLCCHTQGQERFALGDLHGQTFAEVWHGQRAKEVYEGFDPRTTCPPACRLHLQNAALHEISQPVTHENFI